MGVAKRANPMVVDAGLDSRLKFGVCPCTAVKLHNNFKSAMNPCIYYHPEAYTTSGPKLMGRNAAGESFLRGFIEHAATHDFWVQVEQAEHAQSFAQTTQSLGRHEPVRVIQKSSLGQLAHPGCVYYPGPGIGNYAWQRAAFGHASWSLCGITHTTSSARAMDAIVEWLSAPVQPWDAVICTSKAVKANVESLLQAQADHLAQRLGATRLVLPQLPVIPLGIHTTDFVAVQAKRQSAREALGIAAQDIVVLFAGRLSFHAKAHPLAMYQAVESAWQSLKGSQALGGIGLNPSPSASKQSANMDLHTDAKLVLIECGWHANDFIAKAYRDAAQLAIPSARSITLDGRIAESRNQAWAAADVFCSLSDNIQETFGMTPIEAMAAGLPVIVSDWDGYKDTVRDGLDGYRIPTWMPASGLGTDLSLRHALEIDTYDMYCGHSASFIAVDIEAARNAFVALFESSERRKQMGACGQAHAVQHYDWSVIMTQYQSLWAELSAHREKAQATPTEQPPRLWPARMDPFLSFAAYPTKQLEATSLVRLNVGAPALLQWEAIRSLAMVNYAKYIIPNQKDLDALLTQLEQAPSHSIQAGKLVENFSIQQRPYMLRTLLWLAKLGVVSLGQPVSKRTY